MKKRYLEMLRDAGQNVTDAVFSHISATQRQLWVMTAQ